MVFTLCRALVAPHRPLQQFDRHSARPPGTHHICAPPNWRASGTPNKLRRLGCASASQFPGPYPLSPHFVNPARGAQGRIRPKCVTSRCYSRCSSARLWWPKACCNSDSVLTPWTASSPVSVRLCDAIQPCENPLAWLSADCQCCERQCLAIACDRAAADRPTRAANGFDMHTLSRVCSAGLAVAAGGFAAVVVASCAARTAFGVCLCQIHLPYGAAAWLCVLS
jgi:hypothetical protein